MCFSANASFGASAVLFLTTVISVKKATTGPQYVLACTPLFFSIQQFCEGLLWLSLTNPRYAGLYRPSTYAFLFFAQVIWPTMVPLTVMLLEPDSKRKKLLKIFLGVGGVVSLYTAWYLFSYGGKALVQGGHIRYDLYYPRYIMLLNNIAYFIPTLVPPLISGIKRIKAMGVVLLFSYIISRGFYGTYVISVWCYFAAVISFISLSAIIYLNKRPAKERSTAAG